MQEEVIAYYSEMNKQNKRMLTQRKSNQKETR